MSELCNMWHTHKAMLGVVGFFALAFILAFIWTNGHRDSITYKAGKIIIACIAMLMVVVITISFFGCMVKLPQQRNSSSHHVTREQATVTSLLLRSTCKTLCLTSSK